MPDTNLIAFYKSINEELTTVKNRVRNLIGNRHWGKEGEYKEAILRNVIRRFLPTNYSIGTGFVLANYGEVSYLTSQIDIIIYDNAHPLLFREGDFVIVTPQAVRAIIEVKTQLKATQFEKIVRKIIDDALLIRQNQGSMHEVNAFGIPVEKPQDLFIGLFSYGTRTKVANLYAKFKDICLGESQKEKMGKSVPFDRYMINNIVLSKDFAITFKKYSDTEKRLTLYKIKDLSYSNFIINILWSLSFLHIYLGAGNWYPFDADQFISQRDAI